MGTEAVAAGTLTKRDLSRSYDRIYRNVYLPRGTVLTAHNRAIAAWLWSGRQAVVAGPW
jgi:hypothetical protein